MRWPVVVVQSASGPRLRSLRRARKPTASKNSPADHQGRRHLAGVDQCSPGTGLRSALELRCSSGSCSFGDDGCGGVPTSLFILQLLPSRSERNTPELSRTNEVIYECIIVITLSRIVLAPFVSDRVFYHYLFPLLKTRFRQVPRS